MSTSRKNLIAIRTILQEAKRAHAAGEASINITAPLVVAKSIFASHVLQQGEDYCIMNHLFIEATFSVDGPDTHVFFLNARLHDFDRLVDIAIAQTDSRLTKGR